MNRLTIEDASGNQQVLYFGSVAMDVKGFMSHLYELPPVAPAGIFDARFATNQMAEFMDESTTEETPLLISSAKYPLTIRWDVKQSDHAAMLIVNGKEIRLKSNGVTQIPDLKSQIQLVLSPKSLAEVPKEFTLEQNHPNPFNPSTVIRYEIPVPSSVMLNVCNLLGQEVATLVNEDRQPGVYNERFDGSTLSSGVYYFRLSAISTTDPDKLFTQVKKMLLVK